MKIPQLMLWGMSNESFRHLQHSKPMRLSLIKVSMQKASETSPNIGRVTLEN